MKYKIYKQPDEKNCGVACLAMICAYYGVENISLAVIREFAKTDREGNSMYSLKLAGEKLNLETDAFFATKEDLLNNNVNFPIIVHTVIDGYKQHYIVVFEVNEDTVVIGDPSEGKLVMKWEQFNEIWTSEILTFKPKENFKEIEKYKRTYKLIFNLILKFKKHLFILVVLSAIISGISVVAASFYSYLIDTIIPQYKLSLLWQMVLVITGIYLFTVVVNWIKLKISITFTQKLDKELTLNIFNRITNLPMSFFTSRTSGDLITRFQDGDIIRSIITDYTSDFLIDVVYAVFALIVVLAKGCWPIAVIALVMMLLIIIIQKIFGSNSIEKTRKIKKSVTDIYSFASASFMGSETVKSYNSEKYVENSMNYKYESYQKLFYKTRKLFAIQGSLIGIIIQISQLIMLSTLGTLVMTEKITMGELMFLYTLQGYLLGPIGYIIRIQDKLYETNAALERLDDVFRTTTEDELNKEKREIVNKIKRIEFDNVSFQYGLREPILKNINFSIKEGESIGIIGASGSGKTTLIKLLLNFFEVTDGAIYINDENINNITTASLRKKITYVSQNDFWFQDTIYNNITIGNNNVSEDEVNKVLDIVKMKEYINNRALGLQTKIEEGATNLSTGEKQRLSLAKALLTYPDVLILDESTSNLDTITEEYIVENLSAEKNTIKIIIAHRLNVLAKCDKIISLKNGCITEIGTPYELINNKGIFYELWKTQHKEALS